MPVKWSWAWGPETTTELEEMGWDWDNLSNGEPTTTITYTYVGSPTRYSMRQDEYSLSSGFRLPTECWSSEGWVCIPVYGSGSWNAGRSLLSIYGGGTGKRTYVYMNNAGSSTFSLYVDLVFKESFTMTANDWHYLALQYSMTGSTWTGRVWVDGSPATGYHTDASTAETSGYYRIEGCAAGTRETYIGQCLIYDSEMSDSGAVPRFVTRIEPTTDTGEVGTWEPSVGSTNYEVLSGSWDDSTFTENSGSSVGHNVRIQAQNLATQLGISPTSIDGITVHTWASGSGQNGFTAISDNDSNWDNGTAITPDTNDPTYCFATAPDVPSNGDPWNVTSSVYFKYEVS